MGPVDAAVERAPDRHGHRLAVDGDGDEFGEAAEVSAGVPEAAATVDIGDGDGSGDALELEQAATTAISSGMPARRAEVLGLTSSTALLRSQLMRLIMAFAARRG